MVCRDVTGQDIQASGCGGSESDIRTILDEARDASEVIVAGMILATFVPQARRVFERFSNDERELAFLLNEAAGNALRSIGERMFFYGLIDALGSRSVEGVDANFVREAQTARGVLARLRSLEQ